MYLRCSFILLFYTTSSPCDDAIYKIPVLVLNSAINPLAYAFSKETQRKSLKDLSALCFKENNNVK